MIKKISLGNIYYYQKGYNPKLLLMSGTHGDEYGVIGALVKMVSDYNDELPDYIFIPHVSPSAVEMKTRKNSAGHDINRFFLTDSLDDEALTIMKIVSRFHFKIGVSFHEDPLADGFYIYDSSVVDQKNLEKLKSIIIKSGIELFSGIDDPDDKTLGHVISEGYVTVPAQKSKLTNGDFWDWSQLNEYVDRLFFPEIPGKLSFNKKKNIMKIIFNYIIFPILNK